MCHVPILALRPPQPANQGAAGSNNMLQGCRTMDIAIGTSQADKEAAFTPKRGKIKPIDIVSLERREIDEKTVGHLVEALARDGGFLHPIAVRAEGPAQYRLIAGHHRREVWTRCFGEQRPIPAIIYPTDTPDALIEVLEIEENLLRKELTAAEREVQMLRLAAALRKLDGEEPAAPVSEPGEAAETGNVIPGLAPGRGGRGKKGMAQKVAEKAGIGKRTVNIRLKNASAAIGEKIDLDRDTPEELERKAAELERKADKRQHVAARVVRSKRPKPAPRVEDPTPAESHAAEIGSKIEAARKAFDALARKDQLRFIHDVCLRLELDPLKMAPPAAFGLADEEPELNVELPAQVAPATDDVLSEQAEHGGEAAVAHAEEDDEAAAVQADQGDNGAEFDAEDLQDIGDDVPEAADPDLGVSKCAHCKEPFLSGYPPRMKYGRLYHRMDCVNHAKPIAIAAE